MLFKDSILIDASPDRVWKHIGSPDLWSQFNANVGLFQCFHLAANSTMGYPTTALLAKLRTIVFQG